jgi:hypothetical protein
MLTLAVSGRTGSASGLRLLRTSEIGELETLVSELCTKNKPKIK